VKQFVLSVFFFAASVTAMPRFIVIPIEDVEFMGDEFLQSLPVYPMYNQQQQMYNERVSRQTIEEEEPIYSSRPSPVAQRRDGGQHPHGGSHQGGVSGSFIDAIGAAGIPPAGDNLVSGSSAYAAPPQGVDYVDYGAYTGKHGAFGWYSDHPVCLNCHH
jgi:hypothetical protein